MSARVPNGRLCRLLGCPTEYSHPTDLSTRCSLPANRSHSRSQNICRHFYEPCNDGKEAASVAPARIRQTRGLPLAAPISKGDALEKSRQRASQNECHLSIFTHMPVPFTELRQIQEGREERTVGTPISFVVGGTATCSRAVCEIRNSYERIKNAFLTPTVVWKAGRSRSKKCRQACAKQQRH